MSASYADCARMAHEMVQSLRRNNARYEHRTGEMSSVTESDYESAEDELLSVLLRIAGIPASDGSTGE